MTLGGGMVDTHHHDWQLHDEDHGYHCAECPETCAACIVQHKGQPHPTGTSLLICDACLNAERTILDNIIRARDGMVVEPRSMPPAYAADLTNAHSDDPERLPFGMDAIIDDHDLGIAGIKVPDGVDDTLWGWVALWTDASGHAENTNHVDYLKGHLMWAAHNAAMSHFHHYRREMRDLLGRARHLNPPEVEHVGPHCFDCGGRLIRYWLGDGTTRDPNRRGLGDEVRCETCKREYDPARFRLAFRAKVEKDGDPNALVTEREAREIFPRLGANYVHVWMQRGQLDPAGWRKGRRLFRLGDIQERLDGGAA